MECPNYLTTEKQVYFKDPSAGEVLWNMMKV
jgi:hypothetical protein